MGLYFEYNYIIENDKLTMWQKKHENIYNLEDPYNPIYMETLEYISYAIYIRIAKL